MILTDQVSASGSGISCRPCNAMPTTPICDVHGEWFVAQIRYEKGRLLTDRFVADLDRMGITYFYPQVLYKLLRTKEVAARAMFPGYVFVAGDLYTRAAVRQTNKTSQLLSEPRQSILARQLESIETVVGAGVAMKPVEFKAFVEGTRWRVRMGHRLEGVEGYYQQFDSDRGILTLTVDLIGAASSLEIDPQFVEPA